MSAVNKNIYKSMPGGTSIKEKHDEYNESFIENYFFLKTSSIKVENNEFEE